ncbi:hypothetical protein NQ314_006754 [Rhamnusium bicolor]|uniref:Neurite outgrowth-associated protein n=1 Tax=Rhamnusium bicolor TaxID=1586634 RepID=A0AAV8YZJ1_9CUCU|nr:hypothetical protein NQ314_006754 [Rhamnusium bicolor]
MLCLRSFIFITKPNINNLSRAYVPVSRTDPGIQRRKKILNSNQELEEMELDDLESDFMNLHKTHREHVKELYAMQEKEKFHIIKQKYFKDKFPNFLTWHDKEQIRYLHSTDPEEWTIDKLSEGFPALPEVIRSKWTKNQSKIANHDMSVQKNWEMYKKGQFSDLPKDLVDHLNKFTNRSINLKPFEVPESKKIVEVNSKKIGTEFSEIITSYEKLKNSNKSQDTSEEINVNINKKFLQIADDKDTYFASDKKCKKKKLVTLNQLQSKIEEKALGGEDLSEDDKLLLSGLKQRSESVSLVELKRDDITDIAKNKYETSSGKALTKKTESDYGHLIYPERITIPAVHRKRGYTYKLNDCYYDDDGEFLYRVPGMG